jgi:hypothetical protein
MERAMGDQQEQDAMPADHGALATGHWMAWFGWMFLFGTVGILTTVGLHRFVDAWCPRDEVRSNRALMTDQIEQLRNGEINCLIAPDSRYIEELLAERAAAAAVRDVYVGGDLSDPRLACLRELPNLKCIVFLFAKHPTPFLQRMHGTATIEELSFDCTQLARADVEQIASFPNLKSLGIGPHGIPFGTVAVQISDLDGLRGHPSLERLRGGFGSAGSSSEIDALLQRLLHLRKPGAGHATTKK